MKMTTYKMSKEYIEAENQAYDTLVKNGFSPQGRTKDFKKVVVFKIENENKNNEIKEDQSDRTI